MKASRSVKSVTNEITHPIISDYFGGIFYNANAERECRKKTTGLTFEGLNPALFREFATECMELARGTGSRKERTLFLKLSGMWEQLAQSWEKKGLVGANRSATAIIVFPLDDQFKFVPQCRHETFGKFAPSFVGVPIKAFDLFLYVFKHSLTDGAR